MFGIIFRGDILEGMLDACCAWWCLNFFPVLLASSYVSYATEMMIVLVPPSLPTIHAWWHGWWGEQLRYQPSVDYDPHAQYGVMGRSVTELKPPIAYDGWFFLINIDLSSPDYCLFFEPSLCEGRHIQLILPQLLIGLYLLQIVTFLAFQVLTIIIQSLRRQR